ncbi:MAG: transcription antitermination factor NusB [Lachnospiraceae bacterium]|nr:transcription antitermination factor NusB [Lachnospiraceae bacterium]
MKRSEIRETVFKLLFRAEFNDISEMPEQTGLFFDIEQRVDENPISEADREYIKAREEAILAKLPEIDAAISEKAVGWTIERMGKADLAIIRLAVYEIMFDDDIPVSVAINEAVELAKKYGREESGGFVNGVLAKFAK